MLQLAVLSDQTRRYAVFEQPREIEYLSLQGLGHFKKALGMDDYLKYFQSWITRQGPVLLGCIEGNSLLSWCMFERWDRSDRDKTPIYVLRTIEVQRQRRGQKIGLNLVTLVALVAPGHIVTRPLSNISKAFFQRLGFIEPPSDAQVDFHDKYGYLLLPSLVKQRHLPNPAGGDLVLDSPNVARCSDRLKTALLREEISQATSFAQAFVSLLATPKQGREAEKVFIKSDTARIPCRCGATTIHFYTVSESEQDHLSVECAKCGDVWLTVPV